MEQFSQEFKDGTGSIFQKMKLKTIFRFWHVLLKKCRQTSKTSKLRRNSVSEAVCAASFWYPCIAFLPSLVIFIESSSLSSLPIKYLSLDIWVAIFRSGIQTLSRPQSFRIDAASLSAREFCLGSKRRIMISREALRYAGYHLDINKQRHMHTK